MKYIRTKYGVYELKVNEELKAQKTSNYFYINDKRFTCNLLLDKQYVKKCRQADTIEELCDEFVIISGSNESVMYQTKDYLIFRNLRNKDYRNHKTIHNAYYGAIWTEWGLKYVAKMNDKGELELL